MKIEQTDVQEEPRFSFDEVKDMIEKLLSKQNRSSASATASLKRVDFDDIAAQGHSVESCKELLEELIQNTRRVRTLREVLEDIKDNLKKSRYTEIIARTTIKGDLPRRPPSAYLLYHADRYNQLKKTNPLAVEISKIVSEEWRNLPDKKRRHYHRKQEELLNEYEEKMRELGLIDEAAPKRPKSAKALYIDHCMGQLNLNNWSREELSKKREKLAISFDGLKPEEKAHWIQLQKQNQDQFQADRQAFIEAHPHLSHQDKDKKPRLSEKLILPEPPKTAVKFFIAKKLPEDIKPDELDQTVKHLKEQFNNLKDKKQLKYIKKAVQDKERYDAEVDEFNRENPDRPIPKPTKPNLTKEQMKIYSRIVENRPEMPAPTAYLYYCGKMLTEMMNNDDDQQAPTTRMKYASEAWRKLSSKERKTAIRSHTDDMERYVNDMDRWLASQPEDRKLQILSEEPKANPEYWRKKLNRLKKRTIKQDKNGVVSPKKQNGFA